MIRGGRGRPAPLRLPAPLAMRWGKTTASCRWPGVKSRVKSVPAPSARRWTFVPSPLGSGRARRPQEPLCRPSRVRAGPEDGAIEELPGPVELAGGLGLPGGAGAEDPQHAVEHAAVIDGQSPRRWCLRWEQRLQPRPGGLGEVASGHGTQDQSEIGGVGKHALV